MAQHKKIYFSGRKDPDTGYSDYLKLKDANGWIETEKIEQAHYVFVGGYLSAIEAFLSKQIVLASYSNPVKKDYWLMHPMSSEIGLNGKIPSKYSEKAYEWAKNQTWEKLAKQYEELWQK